MSELLTILSVTATVIVFIVGTFCLSWHKMQKETISLLKEQNEELRKEKLQSDIDKEELKKEIIKMKAEIDNLKSIPLKQLAEYRIKVDGRLSSIESTNKNIVKHIKGKQ